jgi:HK97 family phage major capsid protein
VNRHDIPLQLFQGPVPTAHAVYRAPILGFAALAGLGLLPADLGITMLDGGAANVAEITPAQLAAHPAVQQLLADTARQAAEAAVRAVNTVDPDARPGGAGTPAGTPAVPAYNRQRYGLPRLGQAMRATYAGGFRQSQAFERDFTQAAKEIFGYAAPEEGEDDKDPFLEGQGGKSTRSLIWPKTRDEMVEVLDALGEKPAAREAAYLARIESGVRAMSEASVGAGGALVPTQYLQDKFQYALVSMTAIRRSGVDSMPAASNIVILPRESVPGGASVAAEAATLAPQDATLAQQTITIKKQYGYRLYSNELLADATPAWNEFLANTLVRDVALKQDQQFLEGTGAGNEITGLVAYAGTTAGPAMGANGGTPTIDNVIDSTYLLRAVNVEPDVAYGNPRTMQTLSKIKDSTGNYILWAAGGYNAPRLYNGQVAGMQSDRAASSPSAVLLGQIDFYFSNQMLATRTVGTSADTTDLVITNRLNLLIVERQGIEVAYSEHVAFNSDQTAARAIGRAAIVALQPTGVELWVGIRP